MPKQKIYGSHTETVGGGSWWINVRAETKADARKKIRKKIKSQTDAKIITMFVERQIKS